MAVKYVVAHRVDRNNVGDMASNPLQYFLPSDEYQVIDVGNLDRESYPSDVPLIVGGGGLFGNDFFGDTLSRLLMTSDRQQLMRMWDERWSLANISQLNLHSEFTQKFSSLIKEFLDKLDNNNRTPKIVWGAGHNGNLEKKTKNIKYPDWLSHYNLVGVRDWNQGLRWVPCASCMHPSLRKKHQVKNQVIWFEHKKQLIKDFGKQPIPRFVNSGDNIEQTIELLGSANIILTNSYHGAYWGTLLKKRVIVVGPWSSKFHFLKHNPTIVEKVEDWETVVEDWETVVEEANIYETALDECITETENYWKEIKQL